VRRAKETTGCWVIILLAENPAAGLGNYGASRLAAGSALHPTAVGSIPTSSTIYVIRISFEATKSKAFLAQSDFLFIPEAVTALFITLDSPGVSLTDIPGALESCASLRGLPTCLGIFM